jgi:uncharacterized protein (DUF1499 family)
MHRPRRGLLLLAFPALLISAATLANLGCASRAAGVVDGHLAPYSERPNGVSTQSTDAEHHVAPLRYAGGRDEGRQRLLAALASLPRVQVVEDRGDYLHATATSLVWRFTDDLEFLFATPGEIQARSCARVGYGDFGVNRRRIERIRALVEAPEANPGH